jgi:hypothetical protein
MILAVFSGSLRLDSADVLELLHLLWCAGCRDDHVTTIDQFLENGAACLSCGSVENDFQLDSLYGAAGCIGAEQTYTYGSLDQVGERIGPRHMSLRPVQGWL